jgi:hypothetical protein
MKGGEGMSRQLTFRLLIFFSSLSFFLSSPLHQSEQHSTVSFDLSPRVGLVCVSTVLEPGLSSCAAYARACVRLNWLLYQLLWVEEERQNAPSNVSHKISFLMPLC